MPISKPPLLPPPRSYRAVVLLGAMLETWGYNEENLRVCFMEMRVYIEGGPGGAVWVQ